MRTLLHHTALDRTQFPELRDRILQAEADGALPEPRSYPGYPCWPLARSRPRWRTGLDRVLATRRCVRELGTAFPSRKVLGRMLQYAHGVTGDHARGPVPSAGGLQGLELCLVHWAASWLPAGAYHYDRSGHHLAQIVPGAERGSWQQLVPSLETIRGGALLWVVVGDEARVGAKYGSRGGRFLLLEAGHLMQNLCLLAASLGLATVPLGGFFEGEVARELRLPPTDAVLYVAACGPVGPAGNLRPWLT